MKYKKIKLYFKIKDKKNILYRLELYIINDIYLLIIIIKNNINK